MIAFYLALFWTVTAFVGIIFTSRNLTIAYHGWRYLRDRKTDLGMEIMAWSHVRGDAMRLFMHLSFFVLGIDRLFFPTNNPIALWAGTVAIMLVPCELIAVSVTSAVDRSKASKSVGHPE